MTYEELGSYGKNIRSLEIAVGRKQKTVSC
jgi:hypothetical protein